MTENLPSLHTITYPAKPVIKHGACPVPKNLGYEPLLIILDQRASEGWEYVGTFPNSEGSDFINLIFRKKVLQ